VSLDKKRQIYLTAKSIGELYIKEKETMNINVVELEPCKLLINYEADAEQILNKRGEIIKAFKKAPVPGFRPGKASVDAIRNHYKEQIESALKRALAEDAYHNTLFEKKIKPHGAPKFTTALLADGKFSCEFEVLTKPNFELAEYKGMEIPRPQSNFSVTEVTEQILQDLRVRLGEVSPYTETDFVQDGDNIILDYTGSIEGEKIDALSAEGEMLTVGHSQLKEFDNNLLGMVIGDVREFDLVVPENGLPSLQGKTVHFTVTLTMGSKSLPCPLDDQLAQKVGKADFQELRSYANELAFIKVEETKRKSLLDAVINRMLDDNKFEVPHWASLSEAQYLAQQSHVKWESSEDSDKERFLALAEKNCKIALILDKVREEEPEAQLTDQEVFDIVKQNIAKSKSDKSPDEILQEANKTGYLQILFSRIKDEHALEFLLKNINVID
jgi:trigger factor